MNIENLHTLADFMQALGDHKIPDVKIGYNQGSFTADTDPDRSTNQCKTNCCLAGHAVMLLGTPKDREDFLNGEMPSYRVEDTAMRLLGLSSHEASRLFTGQPYHPSYRWDEENQRYIVYQPDAHDAAKAVRSLIKTGEVIWPTKEVIT